MPINIPSNLYSSGRATLDTTPLVNYVLKDQAAKKAAKEAVLKSANDLYKGLNPAGVRQQDLQDPSDPSRGLLPKMQNWYNQAKAGSIDFGTYKEMQAEIERSKQQGKEQLDIGGMVQQNKIELDEKHGDVTKMSEKNLSIYDPRHKPWRQGDLSPFVPELDEQKFYGSVFGASKPQTYVGKKLDRETNRYFMTKEFTIDEQKKFGDQAAALVNVDKSAAKTFTKQTTNPVFLAEAIPVYKEVYGVDYSQKPEEFTADKAAAAATIIRARGMRESENIAKYVEPKESEWEYKRRMGITDGVDDNYLNEWLKNAQAAPPVPIKGKGGKSLNITRVSLGGNMYEGKTISVPTGIIDKFTVDKGKETEIVPMSFFMAGEKVIPLYQKTDENGRKLYTPSGNIIFDTESPYSVPMDFQAFKAELTPFVLRKKTSGLQQTQQTGIYD